MERIYFTITGTSHYFGSEFFKPDQEVRLVKEPDNKADREAIRVELPGLGTVGYVANSPHTVLARATVPAASTTGSAIPPKASSSTASTAACCAP